MDQRRAVTGKLASKYRGCRSRKERSKILEEVVELTGYHRKYAAWLLRNYGKRRVVSVGPNESVLLVVGKKNKRRKSFRPKKYDDTVQKQIVFIWDTFRLCGKRMKQAMPDLIPSLIRKGRLARHGEVHRKLLEVSAATIDRLLAAERAACRLKGSTLTKPSSILKSQIPIVISSELDRNKPGQYQIDLVGHDGGTPRGHFARSLNAMELSSGWIEPRVVINEAHRWTHEALKSIRSTSPVPVHSLHSDNDSAFINERVQRWCAQQGIRYTRGRPYHSNDTCYIEQKNYNIIRQAVGYLRYESEQEVALVAQLYANLRLLVNYFLPSARLVDKRREGSRIKRIYDRPQSPFRRLLENPAVPTAVKIKLRHGKQNLDPFQLKRNITEIQDQLLELQRRKGGALLYPGPSYPLATERKNARLFG
ncbi:MAG: DDE-type integrase/transposase/recombinase [Anaerolineae bacterium]|nr:DDE-type integrase/transposase/recombinase [Anaerolineae bacterium]NIN97914.1 DDE-type integrase/transposase/recombinase [Anaerolineae bacterium]NIQ80893.1 DDE-type integrase/transposase/recombinase [Anaerolineae bacterium]